MFLADRGDNSVATAQKLKPDVILLDIGLPGIDGFAVLETLGHVLPRTPVIVLTARAEEANEQRALDLGAVLFLNKLVSGRELAAAVDEVVDYGDE